MNKRLLRINVVKYKFREMNSKFLYYSANCLRIEYLKVSTFVENERFLPFSDLGKLINSINQRSCHPYICR